jgi:hypothetical protein
MRKIENFKLADVPQTRVLFAVTSEPDYNVNRVLIAENYPDYGEYAVIEGSHCSCYGFDDTEWDAIAYTEEELQAVLRGWLKIQYGMDMEKLMAQLWLMSGRGL